MSKKARAGANFENIKPEDRALPGIRKGISPAALRTFFNIARTWSLTAKEQQGVLGWPPVSTFYKYRKGDVGPLSLDTLTRISLVLGCFKALRILYPDRALADRWTKLPNANPMFGGNTPASFIAHGEMDNLYRVRRLLDARRGGWN